jgi:methylthioribose-1-phosphate isomerase
VSAFTYESDQTPPTPLRTIWRSADATRLMVINQTLLPHELRIETLQTVEQVYQAIRQMIVRGAPLIGATAAYGIYFAFRDAAENQQKNVDNQAFIQNQVDYLRQSRPTAVNLFWAINQVLEATEKGENFAQKADLALAAADKIVADDIETCRQIGIHGLPILQDLAQQKAGKTINILTHCNAGMLGCIQWGTITSPIYQAKSLGIDIHVWVDETRPRNQGANLTAWELTQHGIAHTLITDNTGGILMQNGLVDLVLVGTDRTTRRGDVANKIGTYLKALAAADNGIPFFVALPSTSIDWGIADGLTEIPIEERNGDEVRYVQGRAADGSIQNVLICPATTPALNYGFDVTPARLITGGFITERGRCAATEIGLKTLFPEQEN